MLRFVTRGYISDNSVPTLFTHWGYLYTPTESPEVPTPSVVLPPVTPASSRRQVFTGRVLEDDLEILTIIEAYIKARYS